jgi:hypothetical protein
LAGAARIDYSLIHSPTAYIISDSFDRNIQRKPIIIKQGMDKLNSLQHTPNNYFQHKIQQLMADKKVIHCLHAEKATTQRSGQN